MYALPLVEEVFKYVQGSFLRMQPMVAAPALRPLLSTKDATPKTVKLVRYIHVNEKAVIFKMNCCKI